MRRSSRGWLFALMVLCGAPLSASPLDALAKKLASGAASLKNKKVAVLAFPYHDEKISSGSTLVSERLTTALVERKEVRVLERTLIGEILKEKKLSESGVIDPRSFKTIGKLLDAEAIVTGTLIDLPGNMTEINARLIRTDTGEVLSAGRAVIERTWTDAPCEIVIRRAATPRATTAPAVSPVPAAVVDNTSPVKSLGKSLKLSNENFPGRHYWSNQPTRSATTYSSSLRPATTPTSTSTSAPMYYRPASSSGYNGTDARPLPPPYFPTQPLGSVEEQIIVTPPPNNSSQ